MNINIVKEKLNENIGKEVFIKYSLGRNKVEKFNAKIKETYNYVFIVENTITKEIKSFTYSDVITNMLRIYYK